MAQQAPTPQIDATIIQEAEAANRQGRSAAEAYLKSKGFTLETFKAARGNFERAQAAQPQQEQTPEQILNQTPGVKGTPVPVSAEDAAARQQAAYEQGVTGQFVQGALMGYGDEAASGLEAGLGAIYNPEQGWFSGDVGKKYDERLAANRQLLSDAEKFYPKSSTAANVAGSVTGAVLPAGKVLKGGNLLVKGGKALATGTGLGAVQGFGEGEGGLSQRAASAAKGAIIGAPTGLLGMAVGSVAGKGVAAGWNALRHSLNRQGFSEAMTTKTLEALRLSGYTPERAAQRLDELGSQGMLADVNPGMQAATGATAARDPGAAATVTRRLQERAEGSPGRLNETYDRTIGQARDPFAQREANITAKRGVSPEYEAALQGTQPYPAGTLEAFVDRLSDPARGYNLREQNAVKPWIVQVEHALTTGQSPEYTARQLQRIKFDLADQIKERNVRLGMSSKGKAGQGILMDIENAVDDLLKAHSPGYAEADLAHASLSDQQAAYKAGQKVLNPEISIAENAANVRGYNPTEAEMARSGLRYDINTRVEPKADEATAAARIFDQPSQRAKVEAHIGPQNTAELANRIDRETTFRDTSNMADISKNSRTAQLLGIGNAMWGDKGQQTLGEHVADIGMAGLGGTVMSGGNIGVGLGTAGSVVGQKALNAVGEQVKSAVNEKTQKLIRDVADGLTLRGRERDTLVRVLTEEAASLPARLRNKEVMARMGAALMAGPSTSANVTGPTYDAAVNIGGYGPR